MNSSSASEQNIGPSVVDFSEAEAILKELSQTISNASLKIDFSGLDNLKTRILKCKEDLVSEKDSLMKDIEEVQGSCDRIKEKNVELRRKLEEIKSSSSDFKVADPIRKESSTE